MVIRASHIDCVAADEAEYHAVLIVYPHAVKPRPLAPQFLQPVRRRYAQIFQRSARVQRIQLGADSRPQCLRDSPGRLRFIAVEDVFRRFVSKGDNHFYSIHEYRVCVNRLTVQAKSEKLGIMPSSKSESALIAEQLRRAFDGDAWHGPAVLELLQDVDAAMAAAKPLADVHSIWELVLHIAVWDEAGCRRLAGEVWQPEGAANFPLVPKPTEAAWRKAIGHAKRAHDVLVKTVAALPESRLRDRVPGKKYDFYHMLHGIAQHELYHAGQIAILRKLSWD